MKWQGSVKLWRGPVLIVAILFSVTVGAEPWLPTDQKEVLETLPLSLHGSNALALLQNNVANDPGDVERATELATAYIKLGRAESDPRLYSYARAALNPWWQQQQPPIEVLQLRATLQQHYHNYEQSIQDLKQLLHRQPQNAQALLTLATIQMVQADYKGAQASCSALAGSGNSWVATVCYAQVMGLSGSADRSVQLLDALYQSAPNNEPQLQQWVISLSAEISAQVGHFEDAEVAFKQALSIPLRDPYLMKIYAELLLQQGRFEEVLDFLKNETRDDALLLQLTRAAKRASSGSRFKQYQAMLDLRYEEAALRGSTLHRREEALYLYEIKHDENKAHQLALANWALQKEPADTLILLQTSIAVNDQKTIERIDQLIQLTGLEDSRIQALLSQKTGSGA